ncbi:hypothetical protein CJF31_00011294 [Rutstroemia sp. NJR-2017a BVV2]|nr:hypothetical protein CJF31_00011294 [Rutstroemia sp. NJR-2017a BVV2]
MPTNEEKKDFQTWAIEASDCDRTITFQGIWISIFHRTTRHIAVAEASPDIEKEYIIEAGYECQLHGGGTGSSAVLSDKIV